MHNLDYLPPPLTWRKAYAHTTWLGTLVVVTTDTDQTGPASTAGTPASSGVSAPPSPHDLRHFFRQVGAGIGARSLLTSPVERVDADVPVTVLDPMKAAELTGEALVVEGFLDGIQAALCVTHRQHRPVYLSYSAAGCSSPKGSLAAVEERLHVVASAADHDWYESLDTSIPLVQLQQVRPDEIASAAAALLSHERDGLEKLVVDVVANSSSQRLVVDGSLAGRPVRPGLVGVVKTVRRRYLPDESVLWGMPAGFRSPRFLIPAGSNGVPVDRFSCYVRLHDARSHAWDFGLVRLESYSLDLLEPLGVLAMSERQSAASRDGRYDRHLAGVRATEDLLRARRPAVFAL